MLIGEYKHPGTTEICLMRKFLATGRDVAVSTFCVSFKFIDNK